MGGISGYAGAVNNDLRIAYTDFGSGADSEARAYIVNNGGTYGQLGAPKALDVTSVQAFALNNNAEIAGSVETNGSVAAAAWDLIGGTGSSLAYLGKGVPVYGAVETSINDEGVAVGQYDLSAALFEDGSNQPGQETKLRGLENVDCADAPSADVASAINDAGEIVGTSCNYAAVRFSRSGYAVRLPVAPPSVQSGAEAINQRGDVAGWAGNVAFLYEDNKTTYLPIPRFDHGPGILAQAYGINASDEVVGTIFGKVERNGMTAFVYINGKSYDLNALIPPNSGWYILQALGVNDYGEIVGTGYYNGNLYGVSLKPPK